MQLGQLAGHRETCLNAGENATAVKQTRGSRGTCTYPRTTVINYVLLLQGNEVSEWDEAEKDVKAAEAAKAQSGSKPTNGRTNGSREGRQQDVLSQLFSPVFLEAFVLTFCAEWGDRSQIATIGEHR